MCGTLTFYDGESANNDFVMGCPARWQWTGPGGGYVPGKDFFWIHWQVNTTKPKSASGDAYRQQDPHGVRLHVESPSQANDAALNDLKREVIKALLASNVEQVVRESGYIYQPGRFASSEDAQKGNKSTEALRVVLTDSQLKPTPSENISDVHDAIGSAVDAVLQGFAARLDHRFPA